jgi:soluble lytic murein transglycosylase-like protein
MRFLCIFSKPFKLNFMRAILATMITVLSTIQVLGASHLPNGHNAKLKQENEKAKEQSIDYKINYCINYYSNYFNIPKKIYYKIAKLESNFDPFAINYNSDGTKDVGLMQVNTVLAKECGIKNHKLLFDVCTNIYVASLRLNYCKHKYGIGLNMVGCYHSESKDKKQKYIKKYLALKNQ